MTRLALLLSASLALGAQGAGPQEPPKASRPGAEYHAPSLLTPAGRIIREIQEHQEAVANLETLCDTIGPRLTGSERLLRAQDWVEARFRAYGLQVLPREAYEFGPTWTRGTESARLLTQSGLRLTVAQLGWSPATPGALRGEAVYLDPAHPEEALELLGTLKGKIVLLGRWNPGENFSESEARTTARRRLLAALGTEGAAAVLMTSDKADGLLNMNGSPRPRALSWLPKIPTGFLTLESMGLLKRLCARRERVQLEVELGGILGTAPVRAFNTLAELRGSEHPEEIVLLGAHIDSWDLGTGATDDGTGVVAVLEALRALQATGLKPKRSIRAVLFSGEEQGLLGSTAYVQAHAAQLPNYQAVLIHDLGTGRVQGFSLQNQEGLRPFLARAIAPLQEWGVKDLPLESSRDSDHAPFVARGVPAFFGVQAQADYFFTTHHSQADTFEHVQPEHLVQGAIALAVTAWELANMAERLPHGPSEEAAGH